MLDILGGALFRSLNPGGRFGYFIFFLLGGAERGVRGAGKGAGGRFLLKIPGGGGPSGGWGRRGEGLGGCLRGIWGAKYFFSGPKFPGQEKTDTN